MSHEDFIRKKHSFERDNELFLKQVHVFISYATALDRKGVELAIARLLDNSSSLQDSEKSYAELKIRLLANLLTKEKASQPGTFKWSFRSLYIQWPDLVRFKFRSELSLSHETIEYIVSNQAGR